MKQQIDNIVAQIKSTGLTDIKLLALVTDNSYEELYARLDGRIYFL